MNRWLAIIALVALTGCAQAQDAARSAGLVIPRHGKASSCAETFMDAVVAQGKPVSGSYECETPALRNVAADAGVHSDATLAHYFSAFPKFRDHGRQMRGGAIAYELWGPNIDAMMFLYLDPQTGKVASFKHSGAL